MSRKAASSKERSLRLAPAAPTVPPSGAAEAQARRGEGGRHSRAGPAYPPPPPHGERGRPQEGPVRLPPRAVDRSLAPARSPPPPAPRPGSEELLRERKASWSSRTLLPGARVLHEVEEGWELVDVLWDADERVRAARRGQGEDDLVHRAQQDREGGREAQGRAYHVGRGPQGDVKDQPLLPHLYVGHGRSRARPQRDPGAAATVPQGQGCPVGACRRRAVRQTGLLRGGVLEEGAGRRGQGGEEEEEEGEKEGEGAGEEGEGGEGPARCQTASRRRRGRGRGRGRGCGGGSNSSSSFGRQATCRTRRLRRWGRRWQQEEGQSQPSQRPASGYVPSPVPAFITTPLHRQSLTVLHRGPAWLRKGALRPVQHRVRPDGRPPPPGLAPCLEPRRRRRRHHRDTVYLPRRHRPQDHEIVRCNPCRRRLPVPGWRRHHRLCGGPHRPPQLHRGFEERGLRHRHVLEGRKRLDAHADRQGADDRRAPKWGLKTRERDDTHTRYVRVCVCVRIYIFKD
mmetsp:Transcript_9132/g.18698  ORF Transcript_9132/g.18698 Transcript_9132/m.18698 type:complete len:512 (+) Transcript_9132:900-2435(+)